MVGSAPCSHRSSERVGDFKPSDPQRAEWCLLGAEGEEKHRVRV